jgi:hypothetical protein
LKKRRFASMLALMNSENGLPPEVQKFLDTHLQTEADRAMFLEDYRQLTNERDRQNFLARYAELPDESGSTDPNDARRQMESAIKQREQNKLN